MGSTEENKLRSVILVTAVYPVAVVTLFAVFLFLLNSSVLPSYRWIPCYWLASIGLWCLLLVLLVYQYPEPDPPAASAVEDMKNFSKKESHKLRLESTTSSFYAHDEVDTGKACTDGLLEGYEPDSNFPDVVARVTSPPGLSDQENDHEIKQLEECFQRNERKRATESSINVLHECSSSAWEDESAKDFTDCAQMDKSEYFVSSTEITTKADLHVSRSESYGSEKKFNVTLVSEQNSDFSSPVV